MALNLFLGEIVIPAGGWAFTIDAGGGGGPIAKTIGAGSRYQRSTVAGESLRDLFEAQLDTEADTTVTFGDTTGRVSVRNNHGANTITIGWTATALRDALGFTGASTVIGPGATATGAAQAQAAWLPNVEPSNLAGLLGSAGKRIDDARVALSPSGAYQRTTGPSRFECPMQFYALAAARTWKDAEVLVNESLESFWTTVLNPGLRVRWFTDRTAVAYDQELRCAAEKFEPQETVKNHQGLWTVDLLFVPADES